MANDTAPSAELLRRAAKVLREHTETLPRTMSGTWYTRASGVVADDGTDVGMLVVDPYNPVDDAPLMAFIALMHPPVALALADWLEREAQRETHFLAEFGYRVVASEGHALARAILREEDS